MEKQTIKISRFTGPSDNFHHVYITIPNGGVYVNATDGSAVTIYARWDKSRFQMPIVEKGRIE